MRVYMYTVCVRTCGYVCVCECVRARVCACVRACIVRVCLRAHENWLGVKANKPWLPLANLT